MTGRPDEELPEALAVPAGARDVLPTERGELAEIERALRTAIAGYGYREVATPLLEFAEVMDRAQAGGVGRAFRLFDDHGEVLVIRPDLTIPVARLVAGRLADHPGPVRVSYVGECMRPAPVGKAQRVEERQVGLELVGLSGPSADAEVVGLVCLALRGLGLTDLRIGLGDVSLTRAVLDGVGVAEADQDRLREAVRTRNLVAWRRIADALELDDDARRIVATLPTRRGGADLLREIGEQVPGARDACQRLSQTVSTLRQHGAESGIMVDLGVLRDWGYYSGVVFEAYAPGVGRPVALGGRYDGLIGRFGAPRPAVGAAMLLDRIHEALTARNGSTTLLDGIVLAGGIDAELDTARLLRDAGVIVAGAVDAEQAEALASAEGWRFVAARLDDARFTVSDRSTDTRIECADLVEGFRSLRS